MAQWLQEIAAALAALNTVLAQMGIDLAAMATYFGAYVVSPFVAHAHVELAKDARKRAGKPKLGKWQLRILAAAFCFPCAMLVTVMVAQWPLDRALGHSLFVSWAYPAFMKVYMDYLKAKRPALAADFGSGDTTTELRVVSPPESSTEGSQP
ncbi:MAG: hypothetical protein K2Y51_25985 [Gammaproteobacteria bacterium]|nr:hypothetical protein [Gammaproteobacteria bacterium]